MGKLIRILFGILLVIFLFFSNIDVIIDALIWIFHNPGTFIGGFLLIVFILIIAGD